jgi:hypothetical protein
LRNNKRERLRHLKKYGPYLERHVPYVRTTFLAGVWTIIPGIRVINIRAKERTNTSALLFSWTLRPVRQYRSSSTIANAQLCCPIYCSRSTCARLLSGKNDYLPICFAPPSTVKKQQMKSLWKRRSRSGSLRSSRRVMTCRAAVSVYAPAGKVITGRAKEGICAPAKRVIHP